MEHADYRKYFSTLRQAKSISRTRRQWRRCLVENGVLRVDPEAQLSEAKSASARHARALAAAEGSARREVGVRHRQRSGGLRIEDLPGPCRAKFGVSSPRPRATGAAKSTQFGIMRHDLDGTTRRRRTRHEQAGALQAAGFTALQMNAAGYGAAHGGAHMPRSPQPAGADADARSPRPWRTRFPKLPVTDIGLSGVPVRLCQGVTKGSTEALPQTARHFDELLVQEVVKPYTSLRRAQAGEDKASRCEAVLTYLQRDNAVTQETKERIFMLAEAIRRDSPGVREVVLHALGLGADEIQALAPALMVNSVVEMVSLTDNKVNNAAARMLSTVLASTYSSTLVDLRLGGNLIGDKGALTLASAIASGRCALRRLNLNGANESITMAQRQAEANEEARRKHDLDPVGNPAPFPPKPGALLSKHEQQTASRQRRRTDSRMSRGEQGRNIGKDFAADIRRRLGRARPLESVITSAGATALCTAILMGGGDGESEPRRPLPFVELHLDFHAIGDDGAAAMAELLTAVPTIAFLSARNNGIGADGVRALSHALCRNTSLLALDLFDNIVRDECSRFLIQALRKNTTLTHLDVGRNKMRGRYRAGLEKALRERPFVTGFEVFDNKGISKDTVARLHKATDVVRVRQTLAARKNAIIVNGDILELDLLRRQIATDPGSVSKESRRRSMWRKTFTVSDSDELQLPQLISED